MSDADTFDQLELRGEARDVPAIAALAVGATDGVVLDRGKPRAFLVPDGYTLTQLEPEHREIPRRIVGSIVLHTTDSLIEYFAGHNQGEARVYADLPNLTFVALLNDDHTDVADWRDHRATVALQPTPEWKAWTGRDGKTFDQFDFSEFLEQHAHDIIQPDAATMVDVARTFQAKRDVNFRSAVRPADGTVQMQYDEVVEGRAGRGAIDVPDTFLIRIAPFYGAGEVDVTARLRYRIREGDLVMGYALLHADRIVQEAFNGLVAEIAQATGRPVLRGVAPPARTDDGFH